MTELLHVGQPAAPRSAVGADEIADTLHLPRPTAQQRAVIESDLGPALVIAGAGSGKTETMAGRVLWLLANGKVQAGDILGLTFTRKAAGELSARIRQRVGQLAAVGLVPEDHDDFDPPVVATYNSFANTIYRDNAILLGRESDAAVLGEASAWQLARTLVVASTDPRLAGLDKSVDSVTKAVLSLGHALSENVADGRSVADFATRFAGLVDLPSGDRYEYADVAVLASTVGALPVLLDLAEQYQAVKARRGFVEYSDQVALALQILRRVPQVGADLRDRYKVVLLDEYQDTSVVQTWLLAELFAGHPVMAVGDPNQSIYGWRGASAANLEQFAAQFGAKKPAPARPVPTYSLTTSWRNGHGILAVANALIEPLIATTRVPVERLDAAPRASSLPVDVAIEETLPEEAEAAALWLEQRLAARDAAGEPPTAAVLFRTRATQGSFVEALRAHGIPFHLLGIGGLMAEPEIADLVCALTVINDPTAGSELVRLLAGSRWRIGVKDLHALSRVASWLLSRDYAQQPLDEEVKRLLRTSVADGEGGSIVDALDFLAHAREGHGILEAFSETGLARLREAGRMLARLRARSGMDLLDFVTLVEQELLLDIEVAANESRSHGPANMEAFFDALNGYLAVSETAGLGGFLGWLREAEWRDGLSPRPEDAEPGTVQLLTIHGAKGLEWDLVVVPRLVEGELPATPLEGTNGWLTFGALPYEFRGDAAELPQFAWRAASTRKQLLEAKKDFKAAVKARHELEERRLAYVAVTRARHSLLLTGSFWAGQTTARPPSPFLAQLAESGVIGPVPVVSEYQDNPLGDDAAGLIWPLDPLGGRRAAVERAAELVRAATGGNAGRWETELDLLLEERRRALDAAIVEVPARVPASRFKDYVADPASALAALRRPMPGRPYRASQRGTLFHSWVENRYGMGGSREVIDALDADSDADDPIDAAELARLRATFEHSRWAGLRPIEVEREIHLPFAGRIVICKLDAVYFEHGRYEVVDWKTGKAPRDAADLEQKQLQLALYRLAYSKWKKVDLSLIDAVFYYVGEDRVITPERIFDEPELLALWHLAGY